MSAEVQQIRIDVSDLKTGQARARDAQERTNERLKELETKVDAVKADHEILVRVEGAVGKLDERMTTQDDKLLGLDRAVSRLDGKIVGIGLTIALLLPLAWHVINAVVNWMKN